MTRSLAGASVLVAGASGGLGAPISRLLAARGARLTVFARTRERLTALGVGHVVAGDIGSSADCAAAVAAALDVHGRLDGVVNAAGVVAFGPLAETDDLTLDWMFAVNVIGPLRLVRAALPHLSEGSFVVNVSAVVAEQPVAGMAAYSATKAALSAADVALARELRKAKVTVIDARPPHTETGLAQRPIAGQPPTLPSGKAPDEVAATIVAAIESDLRDLPSTAF